MTNTNEAEIGALLLVADLRAALGDNGKRMQDELIAYARELAALKARVDAAPAGELIASLARVELRDVDATALALNGKRVRLLIEE